MRCALLLASCLVLSPAIPAFAQYATDNPYNFAGTTTPPAAQQQQQAALPRLPDIGRPYAIRVTTGAHTVSGWENSLTSKDSNLKHWTWIPVTTFDQGYIGVNKATSLPKRPDHMYVKPVHVNEAAANRPDQLPPPLPQSHYVKPIHVPLPGVDHGPPQIALHNQSMYQSQASSHISATIHVPKSKPVAVAPPTHAIAQTRNYGGSYANVSGCVRPSSSGTSYDQSVRGRLLSHR